MINDKFTSYPKPPRGENLFACYGVNYGEVPLDANDDKDKNACGVTQRLDKHIHFAQEFTKHPAETNQSIIYLRPNFVTTKFNAGF